MPKLSRFRRDQFSDKPFNTRKREWDDENISTPSGVSSDYDRGEYDREFGESESFFDGRAKSGREYAAARTPQLRREFRARARQRNQAMPDRATTRRARGKLRQGKSASTAAGEFVREEMHHLRQGKHGAKNRKQAVAVGLSKARRAGIPLKPQKGSRAQARKRAAHA